MRTRIWAIVAALGAAAAVAVPTAFADPPGHGLFATHTSHCTGTPLPGGVYDGYVTLVAGGGATFWVSGIHLVIQQYDYTPDGGTTQTVSIGQGIKTGLEGRPTVVCQGHFDEGYTIRSTSVVVP